VNKNHYSSSSGGPPGLTITGGSFVSTSEGCSHCTVHSVLTPPTLLFRGFGVLTALSSLSDTLSPHTLKVCVLFARYLNLFQVTEDLTSDAVPDVFQPQSLPNRQLRCPTRLDA
jgi:hypothetical protein